MKHIKLNKKHNHVLYTICLIGFVYALHLTLPLYINSTFLKQFTSEENVGLLYTLSSIVTIAGFVYITHFLKKHGNYRSIMYLCVAQILVLIGIAFSRSLLFIAPLFILTTTLVALIGFGIDIFLETYSTDETTGTIRGLYMTSLNIAWILSPLLAGSLLTDNDYWKIYAASLGLILPLAYLLHKNFRSFKDPVYNHLDIKKTLKDIWKNNDLRKIFSVNILLNLFYAWMIIYSPLYLHEHIGFDWDTIALIFTIMLLPFVIFELPLGELADKRWGEKELMLVGFLILGTSTIALSYINGAQVWYWMLGLFMTRVGASIAEIMIETYFFKKVRIQDSSVLGLFRITRPMGFLIAPILTAMTLPIVGYKYTFAVLGVVVLCGLLYIISIKDTK